MTYIKEAWEYENPTIVNRFKTKNLKSLYRELKSLPLLCGLNEDMDAAILSFEQLSYSYRHIIVRFATYEGEDLQKLTRMVKKVNIDIPTFQECESIDGERMYTLYTVPTQGSLPSIIQKIKTDMPNHEKIIISIVSINPTIDDRIFEYKLTIDEDNNMHCNKPIDFSNFEDDVVKYDFMVYLYLFGHNRRNVYEENSPEVVFDYDPNDKTPKGKPYHIKQLPIIRVTEY